MAFELLLEIPNGLVLPSEGRFFVLGARGRLERRDVAIARREIGVLGRNGGGTNRRQQQAASTSAFMGRLLERLPSAVRLTTRA